MAIQLAGGEPDIAHLRDLGVPTEKPGLTARLLLLDETDSHYIVAVEGGRTTMAIKVAKEAVKAIGYLESYGAKRGG